MSFNRTNPNAAAKSQKKPHVALPKKPKVPKTYERNAKQTNEKENLAKARSLVIAEEKKRYNFLNDPIDWTSLGEFYKSLNELFSSNKKDESDDSDKKDEFNGKDKYVELYNHELYGNHLDMKRWLLFIELIIFLHENSIDNDENDALSFFQLKPFTFGIDDKTSIQQLLTFIQKHKNLSRRFIDQHNKNDESNGEDFDLFGSTKSDAELDAEFDTFYTIEDNIENRNSFGIKLSDEGKPIFEKSDYESKTPKVIQPTDEEVKMREQGFSRFKELQQQWQNRTGASNVSVMKDRMREVNASNASKHKDDDDKNPKKKWYPKRPLKGIDIGAIKRAVKLSQYFDEGDANQILNKIHEHMMKKVGDDATLDDYLLSIARIAVFVDENYLKSVAKTFNEKLSRQYYDLDKLLDVTSDEILQEIYQHPENRNSISTINRQITEHTQKYIETILQILNTNQRPNEEDKEQIKQSLKTSLETIKRSPSLTKKTNCSDEFSDVDDLDIIYYTDTTDGKVYCFKLFDLYEQFERKDFVNNKSGERFNDTFIQNILNHHKKPKSPVKIKEKTSVDDIIRSSLVDIFSETEKGLDPVLKAEYEEEFGGPLFGV